jgi:hypothetical protein
MSNDDGGSDWKGSARGDAAWKETMERVASRNVAARKSGKQRRETYEQERADARQSAEARRHAKLLGSRRER